MPQATFVLNLNSGNASSGKINTSMSASVDAITAFDETCNKMEQKLVAEKQDYIVYRFASGSWLAVQFVWGAKVVEAAGYVPDVGNRPSRGDPLLNLGR